jgi:hypothetical protein
LFYLIFIYSCFQFSYLIYTNYHNVAYPVADSVADSVTDPIVYNVADIADSIAAPIAIDTEDSSFFVVFKKGNGLAPSADNQPAGFPLKDSLPIDLVNDLKVSSPPEPSNLINDKQFSILNGDYSSAAKVLL